MNVEGAGGHPCFFCKAVYPYPTEACLAKPAPRALQELLPRLRLLF